MGLLSGAAERIDPAAIAALFAATVAASQLAAQGGPAAKLSPEALFLAVLGYLQFKLAALFVGLGGSDASDEGSGR